MTQPNAPANAATQPRNKRSPSERIWRPIQWAINVAVLLMILLVFTPIGEWMGRPLVSEDQLAQADYIVVLGGDPGRAVEGARLCRDGWGPKVIISSLSSDAQKLGEVAEKYGLDPAATILDDKAYRTADHPATVAALPGIDPKRDRFIVVTSRFHTARAKVCFRKAGYEHLVFRSPDWQYDMKPPEVGMGLARRAVHLYPMIYEYLAWGYYKLRGWL